MSYHFDPLLAKLIVWAPTRESAIDRMKRALDDFVLLGIGTNIEFMRRIIATDDFALGKLDTAFLDRHPEVFSPPSDVPVEAILAASLPLGEGSREARGARTRQGEASSEGAGSGTAFPDAWTSGPWRNS